MPKGGLEPPRVAPYAPQTYVSTNSTTSAQTVVRGFTSSRAKSMDLPAVLLLWPVPRSETLRVRSQLPPVKALATLPPVDQ